MLLPEVLMLFLTNFLTLNPERLKFHNNIPFGYSAGSGASGSKKLLSINAAIVPAVPLLAPVVLYLASANNIPSSVV